MPSTSRARFRADIFTTGEGTRKIAPPDFENVSAPTAPGYQQFAVLGNGANTITVPTGARGCVIEFSNASVVTKTLKGVTGDTGILLDPIGWNVMRFGTSPPTSFVITTSAADTGCYTTISFF